MRILVICDDFPVPANHGGRVALRNEICALADAGATLDVIAFHHSFDSPQDGLLRQLPIASVTCVPRSRLPKAFVTAPTLPYQVSSRTSSSNTQLVQQPKLIIAHHEWTLKAAHEFRGGLRVPIVCRVHNDEARYLSDLAEGTRGIRRPYQYLEALRAKAYLRHLPPLHEAWLMSAEDFVPNRWSGPTQIIPPVMFHDGNVGSCSGPRRFSDFLFVGALDISHTRQGVLWLLRAVWPRIVGGCPSAILTIAGRNPDRQLIEIVGSTPRAQLIPNPADLDGLYASHGSFLNPVFAGSGINLKLGEPARRGLAIVSTRFGARGLDGLERAMLIASDADSFVKHCLTIAQDRHTAEKLVASIGAAICDYSPAAVSSLMVERIDSIMGTGQST